jgi:D-psicose/D-tagatose/L-ribulose 3-epimerase
MREAARYAKKGGELTIAVEPVNRFETHFLNIAEDAVRYCMDIGTGNMVETRGADYLGYVHVCESNRGIPGTGLVPWKEFFRALKKAGYLGPLVIESFDPSFEELSRLCSIWRRFADSGEALAVAGLRNLKAIAAEVEKDG